MTSSIADYEIVGPIGDDAEEPLFLAVPPARLGLAADRVALRLLPGVLTNSQVEQATRELRGFAAVRSPHLVALLDAGQDRGLFYAMELPALGTLAGPARSLGLPERLRAVAHAARGAHALHESGSAHRKISPSRIRLHEAGAELADPGMARFIAVGLTLTRASAVTDIEYFDSVVLQGAPASRASDVWSLAVCLHWALSDGQSIHPGLAEQQPVAAVRQVLNERPVIAAPLPGPMTELIRESLAPDPADRPATAADFADRVDRYREDLPVAPVPTPDGQLG